MTYRRYSKYSIENPRVWAIGQDKDAPLEVPQLIQLLKNYGIRKGNLLDMGCGVGSHVYEFSKKGFEARGEDADPAKITFAQERWPELDFGVGDMRKLDAVKRYGAILCINSILVFNETNQEVLQTLKNFHRALKKKGLLIVEMSNPFHYIKDKSFKETFVDRGKDRRAFGLKVDYEEDVNPDRQTMISKRTFYRLDNEKKVGVFRKETRMFFPQELQFFLEQAGFSVEGIFGGIGGRKGLRGARRILAVGRKK